jgi:TetR/AcrR family transcriptional repressor of uid operon
MDHETRKESSRQRIIDAARRLFSGKGFHSTPISELASEASVSVGLIYRLFPGKDDIIVAIAEENVQARVGKMQEIFDAVEQAECSVFDAIKAIAKASIINNDGGLSFEILAEAYRNPRVSERLKTLAAPYRGGIRRLATLARPSASARALDAYADIMMACFVGLGHRTLIATTVDIDQASFEAACLLLRALDAPDHRTATSEAERREQSAE